MEILNDREQVKLTLVKSEYYQIIAKLKLHLSPSRDQLAEIVSQLEIAEANSKFVEPDFWLRQFEVFQKAHQYLGKTVENEVFEFYLNRLTSYTQENLHFQAPASAHVTFI